MNPVDGQTGMGRPGLILPNEEGPLSNRISALRVELERVGEVVATLRKRISSVSQPTSPATVDGANKVVTPTSPTSNVNSKLDDMAIHAHQIGSDLEDMVNLLEV